MKLKYYLRGLGLGILFTAMIMCYHASKSNTGMTDEQVRLRAKELGMTENTLVADLADDMEKMPESVPAEESVTEPDEGITETAGEDLQGSEEGSEVPGTAEENAAAEDLEAQQSEGIQGIQINRGEGSETVSRRLEEAGLVSSASDYNKYLCQNGYDKKLSVGYHEIPIGATEAEIAKLLSSKAK